MNPFDEKQDLIPISDTKMLPDTWASYPRVPGMPGTFSPLPGINYLDMHLGIPGVYATRNLRV